MSRIKDLELANMTLRDELAHIAQVGFSNMAVIDDLLDRLDELPRKEPGDIYREAHRIKAILRLVRVSVVNQWIEIERMLEGEDD